MNDGSQRRLRRVWWGPPGHLVPGESGGLGQETRQHQPLAGRAARGRQASRPTDLGRPRCLRGPGIAAYLSMSTSSSSPFLPRCLDAQNPEQRTNQPSVFLFQEAVLQECLGSSDFVWGRSSHQPRRLILTAIHPPSGAGTRARRPSTPSLVSEGPQLVRLPSPRGGRRKLLQYASRLNRSLP